MQIQIWRFRGPLEEVALLFSKLQPDKKCQKVDIKDLVVLDWTLTIYKFNVYRVENTEEVFSNKLQSTI